MMKSGNRWAMMDWHAVSNWGHQGRLITVGDHLGGPLVARVTAVDFPPVLPDLRRNTAPPLDAWQVLAKAADHSLARPCHGRDIPFHLAQGDGGAEFGLAQPGLMDCQRLRLAERGELGVRSPGELAVAIDESPVGVPLLAQELS